VDFAFLNAVQRRISMAGMPAIGCRFGLTEGQTA
jgi:hypothetical protein